MGIKKLFVVLAVSAGVTAAFFGCGTGRPGAAGNGSANTNQGERCTPGTVRDCSAVQQSTPGIKTCYRGTQTCSDKGFWSACGAGSGTIENLSTNNVGRFIESGLA